MDKVDLGRSAALAVGVVVGLVIALILLRYMNRDHKVKAEYDEMQKIIRNKGYMLAFYAVMILEALLCLVPGSLQIPAEPLHARIRAHGHLRLHRAGLVIVARINDCGIGAGDPGADVLPRLEQRDGQLPPRQRASGKAPQHTAADHHDIEGPHA